MHVFILQLFSHGDKLPEKDSKGFTTCGPIREAFICIAATLLCVPEQYNLVLAQTGQGIAPTRSTQFYNESRFGTTSTLDMTGVARFLASVSMTFDETEQWQPWAAAYVDMELEEHPNSSHAQILKRARDRARMRIDKDSKWVLAKIHATTPGNYNPELKKICAARQMAVQTTKGNAKASSSSTATEANLPLTRVTHPDTPEEDEVQLYYGDQQGEDLSMKSAYASSRLDSLIS